MSDSKTKPESVDGSGSSGCYAEFSCVDDTHYIHTGDNANGKPCNSSINPAGWDGDEEYDENGEPVGGWTCLGCRLWWPEMPEMEHEGLNALRHMRDDPDSV